MLKRSLLVGAIALVLASAPVLAQTAVKIGPSFTCPRPAPADGLAQMICENADMSREEVMFEQAYYALRQLGGPTGWRQRKIEAINAGTDLRATCGMPPPGAPDQTMPPNSESCYIRETEKQRALWLSRMSGPPHEEASRPIEQHIALQQRLVVLGFLPTTIKVDGIYGAETRAAIATWQRVERRPEASGFISDADADALLSASDVKPVNPTPVNPVGQQQDHVASAAETRHPLPLPPVSGVSEPASAGATDEDEKFMYDQAVQCFQSHYVTDGGYTSLDGGASAMKLDIVCAQQLDPIRASCIHSTGGDTDDHACNFSTNILAQIYLRQKERGVQDIDGSSVMLDFVQNVARVQGAFRR